MDVPDAGQARALADALEMGADTAEQLIGQAGTGVLAVQILRDEAPSTTAVRPDPDPWAVPPEKRIEPPHLDRDALIGRRPERADGLPNGSAAPEDEAESTLQRLLKRRVRNDERRLRRELTLAHREERARQVAEARARAIREAEAARPAPPPPPPRPGAPAPAGAANTGVVFPVPDTRRGSERVTYQGLGEVPDHRDRLTYMLRIAGTIAGMVVLAGLLWWAIGSLGDGFGAVIDLIRGGEDQAPDAVGLIRLG